MRFVAPWLTPRFRRGTYRRALALFEAWPSLEGGPPRPPADASDSRAPQIGDASVHEFPDVPPMGVRWPAGRAPAGYPAAHCATNPESESGGIGALVLLPHLVVASAKANSRRLETARTDLKPGEEVRFWWKSGFPSMGAQWMVITTEQLLIPQLAFVGPRTRSIPFSEIYLADTTERGIGIGAYGGGLLVGTTLANRYLELDLNTGEVVRIKAARPQVLQQRLYDAIADWAQRQTS